MIFDQNIVSSFLLPLFPLVQKRYLKISFYLRYTFLPYTFLPSHKNPFKWSSLCDASNWVLCRNVTVPCMSPRDLSTLLHSVSQHAHICKHNSYLETFVFRKLKRIHLAVKGSIRFKKKKIILATALFSSPRVIKRLE